MGLYEGLYNGNTDTWTGHHIALFKPVQEAVQEVRSIT